MCHGRIISYVACHNRTCYDSLTDLDTPRAMTHSYVPLQNHTFDVPCRNRMCHDPFERDKQLLSHGTYERVAHMDASCPV